MTAPEITAQAHRGLAKQTFNKTWDLIELPDRSPEQNRAISDWQVARVAGLLGHGDLALAFAISAFERVEAGGTEDWVRASVLEGLARAHAAAG